MRVQRKYYISARAHKKRFERELKLGDEGSITPVKRSEGFRRIFTFKNFVNAMFGVLAVLNLFSAFFVIWQNL